MIIQVDFTICISVPLTSSFLNSFHLINFWFAKMFNLPVLLASVILSGTMWAISHISAENQDSGNSCNGLYQGDLRTDLCSNQSWCKEYLSGYFQYQSRFFHSFCSTLFHEWLRCCITQFTWSSTISFNASSLSTYYSSLELELSLSPSRFSVLILSSSHNVFVSVTLISILFSLELCWSTFRLMVSWFHFSCTSWYLNEKYFQLVSHSFHVASHFQIWLKF